MPKVGCNRRDVAPSSERRRNRPGTPREQQTWLARRSMKQKATIPALRHFIVPHDNLSSVAESTHPPNVTAASSESETESQDPSELPTHLDRTSAAAMTTGQRAGTTPRRSRGKRAAEERLTGDNRVPGSAHTETRRHKPRYETPQRRSSGTGKGPLNLQAKLTVDPTARAYGSCRSHDTVFHISQAIIS